MKRRMTRRTFVSRTAAAAAGWWIVEAWEAKASEAPRSRPGRSDRLRMAFIGAGGQGAANIERLREHVHIAALCDVDDARAGASFRGQPGARKFEDYRVLLDRMHKEIDAVVVSTPDHMHAPITLAAMELGKHVYCEKPLTRTVAEARRVVAATRRYRVVTQMGNAGNAQSVARTAVEMIRAGAIGPVREVHAWTDRPGRYWPQGLTRPSDTPPVPKTLRWDLWLGVAPVRPYHPAYVPFRWRGWWDFGTGALGDMACHACNVAFWALDLQDPASVECEVSGVHEETGPVWSRVRWEFPARGNRGPVTLYWYDGGRMPSRDLVEGRELPSNGLLLVGEKGVLLNTRQEGGALLLLPESRFAGYRPPAPTIPRSPEGHHAEWVAACQQGWPVPEHMSHFGRAAVMTEALLIGNLAVRSGKRIEWNARAMKVANVPEANAWVDPPYRTGW